MAAACITKSFLASEAHHKSYIGYIDDCIKTCVLDMSAETGLINAARIHALGVLQDWDKQLLQSSGRQRSSKITF